VRQDMDALKELQHLRNIVSNVKLDIFAPKEVHRQLLQIPNVPLEQLHCPPSIKKWAGLQRKQH
jgi:hypothetical protein